MSPDIKSGSVTQAAMVAGTPALAHTLAEIVGPILAEDNRLMSR